MISHRIVFTMEMSLVKWAPGTCYRVAQSHEIRFEFDSRHPTGRVRSVSDHTAGRVWGRIVNPKHQIVYLAHVTRCRRCSKMWPADSGHCNQRAASPHGKAVYFISVTHNQSRCRCWTDDCINVKTRVNMQYWSLIVWRKTIYLFYRAVRFFKRQTSCWTDSDSDSIYFIHKGTIWHVSSTTSYKHP